MSIDVVDLRTFYAHRLGTVARHFVGRGIREHWSETQGLRAARHRLCRALSRPVPRRGRALSRLHAGGAGRGEVADGAADAVGAGGGTGAAAAGRLGRPRAAGPCAGEFAEPHGAAARGLARARLRRAVAGGGAEPARAVGAHGHDAVRPRPALFALADHQSDARSLVHAGVVERSAVRAADPARLVSAFGGGVGARRRDALGAVRRRAHRRGDQAGLSRDPGAPRKARAGAGAQARARAVAQHAADATRRHKQQGRRRLARPCSFRLDQASAVAGLGALAERSPAILPPPYPAADRCVAMPPAAVPREALSPPWLLPSWPFCERLSAGLPPAAAARR